MKIQRNYSQCPSKKIVEFSNFKNNTDSYITLFIDECDAFFSSNKLDITTKDFINMLLNDQDFKITSEDKGTVFELIYNKLRERIGY